MHSTASANSMIKIAGLVVAGVYLFRRFSEGSAEEVKASKTIPPLGRFAVGWGVTFLVLSLLAPGAPTLAGNMALLIMIASVLINGVEISKDLQASLRRPLAEREALAHPTKPGPHGSAQMKPPLEVRSA